MNKSNSKSGITARRAILIVLCVTLSLILALLLAVTIYLESLFGKINKVDPNATQPTLSSSEIEDILQGEKDQTDPDYTGPTINKEDVIWAPDETEPIATGDNIINILLIGQDRREGEYRTRSDAMILCTVNKKTKTITLTSFMRDMYVQIPGYKDNRINVAYVLGGMDLLDQCMLKNFGLTVDGNVEVDFAGFEKIIDLVGGVEIELTKSEAAYMNRINGGWFMNSGRQILNGEQALAYSRNRTTSNEESGDFGRTNRQRVVLTALIQKAKTMSLSQLNQLLNEILPMITTDLSDSEIFGYALELFPLLLDLKIETNRIPADGAHIMTTIDEMSVLLPDLEKNRAVLREIMAE